MYNTYYMLNITSTIYRDHNIIGHLSPIDHLISMYHIILTKKVKDMNEKIGSIRIMYILKSVGKTML